MTDRQGNPGLMAQTNRPVVPADRHLASPAVTLQPVTRVLLTSPWAIH